MRFSSDTRATALLVGLATLLGLLIRAFRLDHPALLLDEITSYVVILESWQQIFTEHLTVDVHPPYYYFLQKLWLVFGESRAAMRSLPVLLGTACIPLLFLAGQRLIGTRVGVIAAFLLTTTPMHVFQSRELRMYSLLNFSVMLAVVGLAYALPSERHPSKPRLGWTLFIIGATSAFYAQSSSALLPIIACGAVLLLVILGKLPRKSFYQCLGASTVVLLAAIPWLTALAHHVNVTLADFWIPEPSIGWAKSQVMGAYPYPALLKPVLYGAIGYGLWVLRKNIVPATLIGGFVIGQPLLMWALSYLRPIMIVRAMVWPTMLAMLLPAVAFAQWCKALMIGATAAFVLLQATAIKAYYPATVQHGEAAQFREPLAAFDVTRDILVLDAQPLEWDLRIERPEIFNEGKAVALGATSGGQVMQSILKSRYIGSDQLAEEIGSRRVWLMMHTSSGFETKHEAFESLRELDRWQSGKYTLIRYE